MSGKTEIWKSRVTAWKASGQTAEVFAASHDFMAGTLRWWASRLRREARHEAAAPEVRLARVVRRRTTSGRRTEEVTLPASGLVLELHDVHVRISLHGRVDRDALAIVLAVLRAGTP
jgi:hypothetical protein